MSKKDYLQNIEGAEHRFVGEPLEIKLKEGEQSRKDLIDGNALLFNSRTTIAGLFEEEILPGALEGVIERSDVRCLLNHNPNYPLARSNKGEGTLKLEATEKGLRYSYKTPDRTYARDLEDAIKSGDISGSSFYFNKPLEERWLERANELPLRQIVKFDQILDVSPVTFPAYPDTSVAKRSLDAYKEERDNIETDIEDDNTPQGTTRAKNLDVFEAQYLINKNNS